MVNKLPKQVILGASSVDRAPWEDITTLHTSRPGVRRSNPSMLKCYYVLGVAGALS
jgi:hypothetical protein